MFTKLLISAAVVAVLIVIRVAVQRSAARMAGFGDAQPPTGCRASLCGACDEKPNDETARVRTGHAHPRS